MAVVRPLPPPPAPLPSTFNSHTSGIYADMSVDGPEIGTLVIVVDRAKNLPNLRTMGKQDPFCAARLGKEAKKTEPDRRGGQTPRWDQELRFIVHDSPDYTKLKISVFNDDKKRTDLIGETWINLEDLIRPGGGQGDAWHPLNAKGRYAGEIRVELTFYDSRPKVEKPRSRKHSSMSSAQSEERQSLSGPRQLTGNRQLPAEPAPSSPCPPPPPEHGEGVPNHPSGSSVHQKPPPNRHNPVRSSHPMEPPQNWHPPPFNAQDGYSRPLLTPRASNLHPELYEEPQQSQDCAELPTYEEDMHKFGGEMDDFAQFVDDPYALQVAEEMQNTEEQIPYRPQASPPRHDRVQALSGSTDPRPVLPIDRHNAQVTPQMAAHERRRTFDEQQSDQPWGKSPESYGSPPIDHGNYDFRRSHSWNTPSRHPYDIGQGDLANDYKQPPPPPPVHRSSAPSVPQSVPQHASLQHSAAPTRSLHHSASDIADHAGFEQNGMELASRQQSDTQPYDSRHSNNVPRDWEQSRGIPAPQPYTQDHIYHHHLSRSADPIIKERDELAFDSRFRNGNAPPPPPRSSPGSYSSPGLQGGPMNYRGPPPYPVDDHLPPLSYYNEPRQPQIESRQQVKPTTSTPDHSPPTAAPSAGPHHRTPRKSVSPRSSPDTTQPSTPYSPDSFNSFNPTHSAAATPQSANKLGPTPMYSSQNSSPAVSVSQSPTAGCPDRVDSDASSPAAHDGPIIGSDGRIKDPTDHLPVSTYAPEPERKQGPKAPAINTRSRFGPREARPKPDATSSPTSPASMNNSPTDRIAKRSPAAPTPSPLTPTHASLLNGPLKRGGGYNMSSPYPPPVPGKIPLGAYQAQVDEPNHFEMAALSMQASDGFDEAEAAGGGPKVSSAGRALLAKSGMRWSR